MQLASGAIMPALVDALGKFLIFLHHGALFGLAEFAPLALLVVNQQQILHLGGPPCPSPVSRASPPLSTTLNKKISYFSAGRHAERSRVTCASWVAGRTSNQRVRL